MHIDTGVNKKWWSASDQYIMSINFLIIYYLDSNLDKVPCWAIIIFVSMTAFDKCTAYVLVWKQSLYQLWKLKWFIFFQLLSNPKHLMTVKYVSI